MARIRPKLISLEVDGVDRSDEASSAIIVAAASDVDFQTYKEAREGGARDYALNMTIAQDPTTGTLHDLIYTSPGTKVDVVYAPFGNLDASVAQPHFAGTVEVKEPDGDFIGGAATSNRKTVATNEVSWPFDEKPTKITV